MSPRRLAGADVEVRIPLVPGITDTDDNLRGIFAFMKDAGLPRAAVLPFNASASAKYEWLGAPFDIDGPTQTPERLARIIDMARHAGIHATTA